MLAFIFSFSLHNVIIVRLNFCFAARPHFRIFQTTKQDVRNFHRLLYNHRAKCYKEFCLSVCLLLQQYIQITFNIWISVFVRAVPNLDWFQYNKIKKRRRKKKAEFFTFNWYWCQYQYDMPVCSRSRFHFTCCAHTHTHTISFSIQLHNFFFVALI